MRTQTIKFLAGEHRGSQSTPVFNKLRRMTPRELRSFDAAVAQVHDFAVHRAIFQICESNFLELKKFYEEVQNEFKLADAVDEHRADEVLNEINRLLMNYLASFRSVIDHYTTRYTRLDKSGSQHLTAFKSGASTVYDGSFAYRFFWVLRNYVQHCGLPVTQMSVEKPSGAREAKLELFFDRDTLLSRYKEWGKVKPDLEAQPPFFEIAGCFTPFHGLVVKIFNGCARTELKIVRGARKSLIKLVSAVEQKFPGDKPVIVDFSVLSSDIINAHSLIVPVAELEQIRSFEQALGKSKQEK